MDRPAETQKALGQTVKLLTMPVGTVWGIGHGIGMATTEPPHIALRIQELFDVSETPKIAMGRTAVLLHILAPNMRPVQITQDLAGFWREHYPKIKSELQRRYPKHQWR